MNQLARIASILGLGSLIMIAAQSGYVSDRIAMAM
jgi:hypothetical protein